MNCFDETSGLFLGYRRLSVVDLSPAGAQPMASHCQHYIIAFNGEIYNHLKLRGKLMREKCSQTVWRGHSFTAPGNDALDRFVTQLEQRFTKLQITKMMQDAGLENIQFSDAMPYWCAVGFKSAEY
jgi:hypothetical protein